MPAKAGAPNYSRRSQGSKDNWQHISLGASEGRGSALALLGSAGFNRHSVCAGFSPARRSYKESPGLAKTLRTGHKNPSEQMKRQLLGPGATDSYARLELSS